MRLKSFIPAIVLLLNATLSFAQNQVLNDVVVSGQYLKLPEKSEITSVFISASGNNLVVSVEGKDYYSILEYTKHDTSWGEPVVVLKSETYIGSPSYSYDANTVFYSAYVSKESGTDIFMIKRQDGKWSAPEALKQFNTSQNELDPCISYDVKAFYFIRNSEENDDDCGDIYYSYTKNGKWTQPLMIVPPINNGCSRFPRIGRDGNTLIYTSKRDGGKNWKLYYVYRFYPGIWTVPEPLDFNSVKENDFCFTTDYKNNIAFFLRGKDLDKKVSLYTAPVASKFKAQGMVLIDGKTVFGSQPLAGVTVDILNPTVNATIYTYKSRADGSYDFLLTPKNNYLLDFHKRGFSHSFEFIESQKGVKNIREQKIDASLFDKVQLKINVYDKVNYEPLISDITIKNPETGQVYKGYSVEMINKGQYVVNLDIDKQYLFVVSKKYYRTDSFELDFKRPVVYDKFDWNSELKPLAKKVVIKVLDEKSGKGVETEVEIVDLSSNKKYKVKAKTDANGNVSLYLREGAEYEVTVAPRGYTFYHATLDLEENEEGKELIAKVKPLEENVEVKLNNINFETNSAELKEDSYKELDRLLELLEKNPSIRVEISAHTDDVGSNQYNLKLSQRRAKAVVNYLVEKGVDPRRLIAKGYGETKPLVPNDSEEHRAMNRRVEFKILKTE